MDDIDGSFFDHIDGLLDFPTEDIDSVFPAMGKSESILPSIWSAHADSLPRSDSVFFGASSCDLSAELSIPYEDIAQLEWLSTFVEESFSGGSLDMTTSAYRDIVPKNDQPFQTSSPVSVLESSSSCSGEKTAVIPGKCGRVRSKRTRPASFSPRPAVIQLVSPLPQCSVHENDHQGLVPAKIPCESSESFAESYNPAIDVLKEAVAVEPKKKKKIKLSLPLKVMTAEVELEDDVRGTTQAPIRKCLHCHITKTPQWRAGPLGPKTLCNACGVRYKSGRLFPEYRPAASPTFVPLLHSNSHKKVLEMRSKTGEKPTVGTPRGCVGALIVKDAPS